MLKRIIAAALVLVASFSGCSPDKAAKITPAHEAALAHFKSGKEPIAKDAVWANPYSFKVGVIDDKTPRDGYAQSVCYTLTEFLPDVNGITVRVIDIVALVRKDEWRTIGTAYCKNKKK